MLLLLVAMAVVGVWVMGMVVTQSLVVVRMGMWFGAVFLRRMRMHVVPVVVVRMHVWVRMAVRGVLVRVRVVFRQMQPHA
jgi:hypothetical protein